jgi:signal transduction histidine kinase
VKATQRIRYGGLVVALSGFAVTRLLVAETLEIDTALPFLIVGLVPLVVGLTLTVYGVALAIGPFTARYANTVARWHVFGVGAMGVVFTVTAAGQFLRSGTVGFGYESPLLVANVLLGGAIGGTLTGIRTGRMQRQQRTISRSANRALLVNRLLRHEVLNAVTIIGGHADILVENDAGRPDSMRAIQDAVGRIKSTIEEVGTITKNGDWSKRVDIESIVREEIRGIETEQSIDVSLVVRADDTEIAADERVAIVVRELLENAAVHGEGADVTVGLTETSHTVELSITDGGPGLPEPQRALLEDRIFPESDDPTAGFGLQIVRLIVAQFGGTIRVPDAGEAGRETRIVVAIPRNENEELTAETVGLSFPNLGQALGGGVLGGIAMGVFFQFSTGLLPVIGSLYGIQTPLIGWITHLFHSAVFGLLFAAICAEPRIGRFVSGPFRSGLVGLGWGAILWFLAAGIFMPVWLSLLGVPTEIPNLSVAGFVGHALWGVILGVAYWGIGNIDIVARLRRETEAILE